MYRCPPNSDCPGRVTISAEIVERAVVDAVRERLDGMQGSATVADGVTEAERELDLRDQELDAAVRAFTGLENVDATRERLTEGSAMPREVARERLAELQAAVTPAVTVSASGDSRDVLHPRRTTRSHPRGYRACRRFFRTGRGPSVTIEPRL